MVLDIVILMIRDKEDDVHHDFAWTITNFSRKTSVVPNGEYIESDKFSVTAHGMDLEWQVLEFLFVRFILHLDFLAVSLSQW